MVWKETKQTKRLDKEKVIKSGWSGRFDKKTNFPNIQKTPRSSTEINWKDREVEEKELKEIKDLQEIERLRKINHIKNKKIKNIY